MSGVASIIPNLYAHSFIPGASPSAASCMTAGTCQLNIDGRPIKGGTLQSGNVGGYQLPSLGFRGPNVQCASFGLWWNGNTPYSGLMNANVVSMNANSIRNCLL